MFSICELNARDVKRKPVDAGYRKYLLEQPAACSSEAAIAAELAEYKASFGEIAAILARCITPTCAAASE